MSGTLAVLVGILGLCIVTAANGAVLGKGEHEVPVLCESWDDTDCIPRPIPPFGWNAEDLPAWLQFDDRRRRPPPNPIIIYENGEIQEIQRPPTAAGQNCQRGQFAKRQQNAASVFRLKRTGRGPNDGNQHRWNKKGDSIFRLKKQDPYSVWFPLKKNAVRKKDGIFRL